MTADVRTQAADLIDAAIDVLHEKGWCQGAAQMPDGRVCVENALAIACAAESFNTRTTALYEIHQAAGTRAHVFNDAPSTTAEDVVLTMKQAAASLREPQP